MIRVSPRPAEAALQAKGIGTEVYYPVPMHLQDCFSYLGFRAGAFPESEGAANETFAIPVYPEVSEAQAEFVVASIREFFVTELAAAGAGDSRSRTASE